MKSLKWFAVAMLLVAVFAGGWFVAKLGIGATVDPGSLSDRERRFTEQMKDSSLVGRFTLAGRQDGAGAPDRYDLAGIEKVGEDRWRFNVRMRHGSVDVTLPVVVPLQWVGDTPMIVMTDYAIPTLGTFSARVFFYGDRYAGTWQNGQHGGHMFGVIEKR